MWLRIGTGGRLYGYGVELLGSIKCRKILA
jgi:hypothetical protein